MAEAISKPLCEANKVTMVSSGDGEVGAAKLTGEVLDIMVRLPAAVEKLTGVKISQVTYLRGTPAPSGGNNQSPSYSNTGGRLAAKIKADRIPHE